MPTGADANIKNIVMIGENAFGNCTSLKLPGLTEGTDATTYSLPANIGYLGQGAFSTTTLGKLANNFTYTPSFTVTND